MDIAVERDDRRRWFEVGFYCGLAIAVAYMYGRIAGMRLASTMLEAARELHDAKAATDNGVAIEKKDA